MLQYDYIVEANKEKSTKTDVKNTMKISNFGIKIDQNDDTICSDNEELKYYKNAAEKGNIIAMNNYGCLLLLYKPDKADEAAHYFKAAADEGDKIGMACYGYILQFGRGVKVNKKEAVRYYEMAIDKECSIAMFRYGLMLLKGDGIKVDKKKAVHYLEMPADKGDGFEAYEYAQLL